jgi:hypothetical protein
MNGKTNACGDRIVYEYPRDIAGWDDDHYQTAVDDVENLLAIIAGMQESRKNEDGEVCEPLTDTIVNTVIELSGFHLQSSLGVINTAGAPETMRRRNGGTSGLEPLFQNDSEGST